MQLLQLHEEEKYPFRTVVRNRDVYHVWNLKEDGESMIKLEKRPRIHIARVATTRQERVPVLCDSEATGHILGEGHMLRQLEDGNLVLFDSQKD